VLDVGLKFILMLGQLFYTVFVDFNFELHAWKNLFGVDLKSLYLLLYTLVVFQLRQTPDLIIQTKVLQSSYELG
jgi:hypothetical protein